MKQAVARNSAGLTIAVIAVLIVTSLIGWRNQVELAVDAAPTIDMLQEQILDIEKSIRELGDEAKKGN